jgi:tRNA threonylcarbamoyladenosine biosynthesis protein TsaB
MSFLLCIETATDICSVAVFENGQLRAECRAEKPLSHAARLTSLIDACCRQADRSLKEMDGLAVSIGPGSFTSLRIGLSTAKGIAYALDKPLLPLSSLAILAAGARSAITQTSGVLLVPMIDARRMEVYCAAYSPELEQVAEPHPLVLEADSMNKWTQNYTTLVLCGNGSPKAQSLYQGDAFQYGPDTSLARYMGMLAHRAWARKEFADTAYVEPFYLKAPHITTPKKVL